MPYSMEEMLPLLNRQMRRFTGGYSSSIPYEQARQLTAATEYCLADAEPGALAVQPPDLVAAFKSGLARKQDKLAAAQRFYDQLLPRFNAYGNLAYQDTIVKGMPQFFLRYDPEFKGYDHLLTLDYPLLTPLRGLQGVELIGAYLCCTDWEQQFLAAFEEAAVRRTLDGYSPHPNSDIFNLTQVVLLRALGCLLVGRAGRALDPAAGSAAALETLLEGVEVPQLAAMLVRTLERLAQELELAAPVWDYLRAALPALAREIAVYSGEGQGRLLLSLAR